MAKVQSPGAVLKALMDKHELNPTALAREIKLSQSAVRQIVIEKAKISVSIALRLAKYFGTTTKHWLELQTAYDLAVAEKDTKLSNVVKSIGKAKLPSPSAKKAAAGAKRGAKPAAKGAKGTRGAKSAAAKTSAKPKAARKPRTPKPSADSSL
jgi:addiction module HigA family antidote